MTEDEILQIIEADMRRKRERIRAMILGTSGEQALADFDREMRNLDLGITPARACWDALTGRQRRTVEALRVGTALVRVGKSYRITPLEYLGAVCSLATARALCRRELLAPDGGAFDPKQRFVLTERGRFVLSYGRRAP